MKIELKITSAKGIPFLTYFACIIIVAGNAKMMQYKDINFCVINYVKNIDSIPCDGGPRKIGYVIKQNVIRKNVQGMFQTPIKQTSSHVRVRTGNSRDGNQTRTTTKKVMATSNVTVAGRDVEVTPPATPTKSE